MTRRALIVAGVAVAAAAALCWLLVRSALPSRIGDSAAPRFGIDRRSRDRVALAKLEAIPLYRGVRWGGALRASRLDADGSLHVDVDVRALVAPRLASLGLARAADLFPDSARGTIVADGESWIVSGPVPALRLLDRAPTRDAPTLVWDAIPPNPSAVAFLRLAPARLLDPDLGGEALAPWRDRLEFAEKILGRAVRAECADDLAGPAAFALYDVSGGAAADAILVVELRRSDRLESLLDMVFGLGALTERATVRRYRGVATGSVATAPDRPGLALAVDGPVLLLASSRARLEAAIDARRSETARLGVPPVGIAPTTTWSAVSSSAFVFHGWCRLARCPADVSAPVAPIVAELRAEGRDGWRLEGHGGAPAVMADPVLPFLRGAFGRRQREGDR